MRIPFKSQMQFLRNKVYLSSRAQKVSIVDSVNSRELDLVSIAFNNEIVIDFQIKLLRKNLTDKYNYIVVDNSSEISKQNKIEKICAESGVNYLRPPRNPFWGKLGSASHGITLNWVYKNFILPRRPQYFGFLDHDIFPIESTSIVDNFSKVGLFGKVDLRGSRWYLWSGFCFFKLGLIEDKKIDFMPRSGLDTGGGNWQSIYSEISKDTLPFLDISCEEFRSGGNKQTDWYERIGSWIHTINASEWVNAPGKNSYVVNLLEKYL